MSFDWMWVYENPKEAAAALDDYSTWHDRHTALIDLQHKALKYASDLTAPDDLTGCDCPICEAIRAYNAYRGVEK